MTSMCRKIFVFLTLHIPIRSGHCTDWNDEKRNKLYATLNVPILHVHCLLRQQSMSAYSDCKIKKNKFASEKKY